MAENPEIIIHSEKNFMNVLWKRNDFFFFSIPNLTSTSLFFLPKNNKLFYASSVLSNYFIMTLSVNQHTFSPRKISHYIVYLEFSLAFFLQVLSEIFLWVSLSSLMLRHKKKVGKYFFTSPFGSAFWDKVVKQLKILLFWGYRGVFL